MHAIDLSGFKFGRLLAIEIHHFKNGAYWKCKCDCGKTAIVSTGELRRGGIKSCGCLRRETSSKSGIEHGAINGKSSCTTHGQAGKRVYRSWQNMLNRCEKSSDKSFKNYGGRGIKVCEAWHDASAFIKWALSHGYRDDFTIDRKDNDGNYEPSNCRWLTRSENIAERNRRLKNARISSQIG